MAKVPNKKEMNSLTKLGLQSGMDDSAKMIVAIFENIPDPVMVHHLDTSIIYVNPALEAMSGYSAQELVGCLPPFPYWPAKQKTEYSDRLDYSLSILREVLQRHFVSKSGRGFDVEVHMNLIKDDEGQPLYKISIWRDITERKKYEDSLRESEEKYRLLVENAGETILVAQDRKIKFINQQTSRLMGYCVEEIIGRDLSDFIHPDDVSAAHEYHVKRLKGNKSIPVYEIRIINKDKSIKWAAVSAVLINWRGRLATQYYLMDVTERKLAEEKLESLYAKEKHQRLELEKEAKARGMFINVLGHELRTPLTPILASTAMLRDIMAEEPDGVRKKIVTNIYNSAEILYKRLEELLDLARYSRGTFVLNTQDVNLSGYLKDVIGRFKPWIEQHGQKLETEISDDLPVALIDPSKVEQVIINLLSNASKFSYDNGTIIFKARLCENELLVEVTDHGIGIALSEQEQLFQAYHRVQQDRQQFPGIGLGLAVSKQIVETHGGKIWLTSEHGKGSTFSFSIPLKKTRSIRKK